MERTFILGVGAQKAGTTWLSDYVRSDGRFVSGPLGKKELHIWDMLDIPNVSRKWRPISSCRTKDQVLLSVMREFPQYYFRYFSEILGNGGLAADVTPSYAGLSTRRLRYINKNFKKHQVRVKLVFLMRDPVSRCVSAFNMNRRKVSVGEVKEGVRGDLDDDSSFLEYVKSDHCRIRTSYGSTIQAITESFEPAQIGLFFYEKIFYERGLQELSDFLGTENLSDRLQAVSNPGEGGSSLSDRALSGCADHYADTYRTIGSLFPEATEFWGGYRYLE